jgi:hypothetical protein
MARSNCDVRYSPKSGHSSAASRCLLCAKSRHHAAQQSIGSIGHVLPNFRQQVARAVRFLAHSRHIPPGTVMASALATLLSICCIAMSIWLFLIAKNWSLSLPATYRYWLPQKNEFIADHCIWRLRTCFELWIFYSSRTLNISAYSSDWSDGWISSGSTR